MWSAGCILVELMTLEPIFPGDSSLEQFIEIVKLLGTPSMDILEQYSSLNCATQLPNVKAANWSTIFKRYSPMKHELDLIRGILTFDTSKRLTPFEALMHPYFSDIS